MNILDRIMHDHENQRSMLKELVETNIDERKAAFGSVKMELLRNADAEESFLYDTLTARKEIRHQANELAAEHNQINEIIEQLDDTDLQSPQWLAFCQFVHLPKAPSYKGTAQIHSKGRRSA